MERAEHNTQLTSYAMTSRLHPGQSVTERTIHSLDINEDYSLHLAPNARAWGDCSGLTNRHPNVVVRSAVCVDSANMKSDVSQTSLVIRYVQRMISSR